jgi:hypothetical protein
MARALERRLARLERVTARPLAGNGRIIVIGVRSELHDTDHDGICAKAAGHTLRILPDEPLSAFRDRAMRWAEQFATNIVIISGVPRPSLNDLDLRGCV